MANLSMAGWATDMTGHFDSDANPGFLERRFRFIKYDKNNDADIQALYRADPVTFVGQLHTNFRGLSQGLVPSK